MALTATVTKKSVIRVQDKRWIITWSTVVKDDGIEVLNKDYQVEYIPGDSVSAKEATFTSLMQADINAYKSEQNIFNAAAMDAAVANVQAALEL